MPYQEPSEPEDSDVDRDFDEEFEAFLIDHHVNISLEESYHISTLAESTEDIRQHNHVVIRSLRTQRVMTLCITSMNWNNSTLPATEVLKTLADEVRIVEHCQGSFLPWASALDCDPDS